MSEGYKTHTQNLCGRGKQNIKSQTMTLEWNAMGGGCDPSIKSAAFDGTLEIPGIPPVLLLFGGTGLRRHLPFYTSWVPWWTRETALRTTHALEPLLERFHVDLSVPHLLAWRRKDGAGPSCLWNLLPRSYWSTRASI